MASQPPARPGNSLPMLAATLAAIWRLLGGCMSVLRWSFVAVLASANPVSATSMDPVGIASPDGRIVVEASVNDGRRATPSVSKANPCWAGRASACCATMRTSPRASRPPPTTASASRSFRKVDDHYELLTSKRRNSVYRANRRVLELQAASGARMDIEFQVSNDGFAFRYVFPETDANTVTRSVASSRRSISSPGTRGWLQPIAPARSGWNESNPSYEEYYERDIPVGQPSLQGGALGVPGVVPLVGRGSDTGCWSARPACAATTAARDCWRRAEAANTSSIFPARSRPATAAR